MGVNNHKRGAVNMANTDKKEQKHELSERARKARNEYLRKWKERNRERVREYNRLYWERVADKNNGE
jgi:hypothetical protein